MQWLVGNFDFCARYLHFRMPLKAVNDGQDDEIAFLVPQPVGPVAPLQVLVWAVLSPFCFRWHKETVGNVHSLLDRVVISVR